MTYKSRKACLYVLEWLSWKEFPNSNTRLSWLTWRSSQSNFLKSLSIWMWWRRTICNKQQLLQAKRNKSNKVPRVCLGHSAWSLFAHFAAFSQKWWSFSFLGNHKSEHNCSFQKLYFLLAFISHHNQIIKARLLFCIEKTQTSLKISLISKAWATKLSNFRMNRKT